MSAAACTSAPVTWPGAPSTCGTRITSAPSPSSMRARAGLLPADIVTSKGCPSAAQATASPAPMLPLVISTTGMPGEPAIRARRQQDGLGGAVLHAAAGLQELGLGDQPARAGVDPVQRDQGRVSYQIQRGGRAHVRSSAWQARRACFQDGDCRKRQRRRQSRGAAPSTAASIRATAAASSLGSRSSAPRFSRSCATPDAPSSTVLTSGLRNAHAIASCARVAPTHRPRRASARRPASPPGGRRRRNP